MHMLHIGAVWNHEYVPIDKEYSGHVPTDVSAIRSIRSMANRTAVPHTRDSRYPPKQKSRGIDPEIAMATVHGYLC